MLAYGSWCAYWKTLKVLSTKKGSHCWKWWQVHTDWKMSLCLAARCRIRFVIVPSCLSRDCCTLHAWSLSLYAVARGWLETNFMLCSIALQKCFLFVSCSFSSTPNWNVNGRVSLRFIIKIIHNYWYWGMKKWKGLLSSNVLLSCHDHGAITTFIQQSKWSESELDLMN